MSEPVLAEKDPEVVLAECLARYKARTGVTLAPADPRRLHLQALLYEINILRPLIDFSGKQSLLRYVSSEWIAELAWLWGEEPIAAAGSTCTLRFTFPIAGVHTVAAGKRGTDGTNEWAVIATTTSGGGATYVDALARCTVTGSATNGLVAGQIDTLVDSIPGCSSVANTTTTISGREIETTEAFRTRLRSVPESRSTCGPRLAYQAAALGASSSVADAKALGPDDSGLMGGYPPDPGEVLILVIEGARNSAGELTSTVPDPSVDLLNTVDIALSKEDVRPLGDLVIVQAPTFVDFDLDVSYAIAASRVASVLEIQAAVEDAFEAYKLWQSRIGRNINPSELIGRIMAAGASRVVVTEPAFQSLYSDQCSRLGYETLTYLGVEAE